VIANVPEKVQECFSLLVDSVLALQRENKEVLWGSMVKETMKRKKPSFNETYYGFRTFSHLLEDAQRRGIVVLRRDQKSGSYIVEDLGTASASTGMPRVEAAPAAAPGPRPVEVVAAPVAAPVAAASAAQPEAAEGNGTRGPRRRRGRSRRPRGASTLAAGAYLDASGSGAAHDEGEIDDHDQDEGDDDLGTVDGGTHAAGAGTPEERPSHGTDAEAAAPPTPEPAHAEPDRHSFSLFSWMRRDHTHEPKHEAEPAAPAEAERKPEEGRDS
jgi:hypothetical protein